MLRSYLLVGSYMHVQNLIWGVLAQPRVQCPDWEQVCSTCMSFGFFAIFVLFRETERLWENWLVAKTAFPSQLKFAKNCQFQTVLHSHEAGYCAHGSEY